MNILTNENKQIQQPEAASILVTEDCNLACTYCFELEGRTKETMTPEVAKRTIDYLIEGAKKNGSGVVNITLFGGEPLMAPDICELLLDYGYERCQEENIRFGAGIITNGTLMNDQIYNFFKKYIKLIGFNTQISVDGTQDLHDFYRVTKNGNLVFI